jgi:catechol 2,3-dioxygenase-like lactoylglutathione lyase family enzyme
MFKEDAVEILRELEGKEGDGSRHERDEVEDQDEMEDLAARGSFDFTRQTKLRKAFDIASFNHLSREVSDVEKSADFYKNVLGFMPIPRPAFEVGGEWLWGHGLNLHIVRTSNPEARQTLRRRRIKYFHENLPSVDHIAFIAKDCAVVKEMLDEDNIYYREFNSSKTGIHQFFFFDPDGNAIEVSNCAPPIGETRCPLKEEAVKDLCYLETHNFF